MVVNVSMVITWFKVYVNNVMVVDNMIKVQKYVFVLLEHNGIKCNKFVQNYLRVISIKFLFLINVSVLINIIKLMVFVKLVQPILYTIPFFLHVFVFQVILWEKEFVNWYPLVPLINISWIILVNVGLDLQDKWMVNVTILSVK
jgi:hypothetical protein